MKAENLNVFVDGIANFFQTVTQTPASVGTPFLIQDINEYLHDFTGVIGISGNHKGSVFFSTTRRLAVHLLSDMGVMTTRDDKLMDLVGEVCNTVSGNARRDFGDQFIISTPVVIQGKSENVKAVDVVGIYVIPIVWLDLEANLVINLEED